MKVYTMKDELDSNGLLADCSNKIVGSRKMYLQSRMPWRNLLLNMININTCFSLDEEQLTGDLYQVSSPFFFLFEKKQEKPYLFEVD